MWLSCTPNHCVDVQRVLVAWSQWSHYYNLNHRCLFSLPILSLTSTLLPAIYSLLDAGNDKLNGSGSFMTSFASPAAGYSRFHAIVSATPRDGGGPPVISKELFRPSSWGESVQGTKRKRDLNDSGSADKALRRANHNEQPANYEDRQQLLDALKDRFKQSSQVDFHGSYEMMDSEVTHKQRIQTVTHEIWKTTGYRFTVKDHPHINNGHKTRFWCSQDEAHRSKPSKAARVAQIIPKPRVTTGGDIMAKPRYPCRSRLLISSRDSNKPGVRIITVRMHHHVAHEPYIDSSLPPEVAQGIWESFGWINGCHTFGPGSLGATGQSTGQSYIAPQLVAPPTSASAVEREDTERVPADDEPYDDDNDSEPPMDSLPPPSIEPSLGEKQQHVQQKDSPPITSPTLSTDTPPVLDPDKYHRRMRAHITNIRDFCDGLEYQLQFNDTRMLQVVETEGASFLRLVEDCLRKEGRLVTTEDSLLSDHGSPESDVTPAGPSADER